MRTGENGTLGFARGSGEGVSENSVMFDKTGERL